MSKELTVKPNNNFGIDSVTWTVLTGSIYVGAKPESVKMAYDYCMGKNIDPLKQYVHIVPMYVPAQKGFRDVIMPGIGLYRHQAHSTGQYAGLGTPEFGPLITQKLGDYEISYPEWCRITVRKLMSNNFVAEFTAIEYWMENYATQNKDTALPNKVWKKRVYGMLAKCTEAQALRKAFEEVSSEPTVEEMTEKIFDSIRDVTNSMVEKRLEGLEKKILTDHEDPVIAPESIRDDRPVVDDKLDKLNSLIVKYNVPLTVIDAWYRKADVTSLAQLTPAMMDKCIIHLEEKYGRYAE